MTIPIERTWCLRNVEGFLKSLCDPKRTPKVPREIRRRAGRLLKHYPGKYDMKRTQMLAPEIWGEEGE